MSNPQQELIKRLKFRVKKLEGAGYLMPNFVADLKDAIAEIQRQDRHLERLGSDEPLSTEFIHNGSIASTCYAEKKARIAYARANRFEDEPKPDFLPSEEC